MKIRIANNIDTVDGGMEIGPEEVGGKMGIERASRLSQDGIIIAADIFKKYPEIILKIMWVQSQVKTSTGPVAPSVHTRACVCQASQQESCCVM